MNWDKYFFSDVGKKIKNIIRGIFYTEVVLLLITGVILEIVALVNLIMEGDGEFFLIMLGIPVSLVLAIGALWLSTLLTYGFAEIVDTAIVNRQEEKVKYVAPPAPKPQPRAPHKPVVPQAPVPPKDPRAFSVGDYWVCTVCTTKNQKDRTVCWCCDSAKDRPAIDDVTAYLGKKWCSGCGNILEKEAASCSCGSKYLTVITAENAHRYVRPPQKSSVPTMCPVCDCELIPFEIDGITMCPECGRTFG